MSRDDTPNYAFSGLATCGLEHALHMRSAYALFRGGPHFTINANNLIRVLDYKWC